MRFLILWQWLPQSPAASFPRGPPLFSLIYLQDFCNIQQQNSFCYLHLTTILHLICDFFFPWKHCTSVMLSAFFRGTQSTICHSQLFLSYSFPREPWMGILLAGSKCTRPGVERIWQQTLTNLEKQTNKNSVILQTSEEKFIAATTQAGGVAQKGK